mgnify:CR=1 FL=1
MKKTAVIFSLALVLFSSAVFPRQKGTKKEAEAMVKKAIEYYQKHGAKKTFEAITNTKGEFVKGDLYVFVYDLKGKCVAHGGNVHQVGKDLIELKDPEGKLFISERLELIKKKGKGWHEYTWSNPATREIEKKTAYVEKADKYIFGCGVYGD